MSLESTAARVYGALTRLYPRRFRDEYGADMVSLFRDQCRDERAWRVLSRSAVDLAISIPNQHLEARMRRDPSPLVPLIYLAVAVAGLLLAIVGGTETTLLVVGLGIALGSGTIGVVAWRRAPAVRDTTVSASWWKFLAAGPCIIAAVILAAEAGVDAWTVGVLFVLLAFVFMAIGVVLGVSHLNRRMRGNVAAP